MASSGGGWEGPVTHSGAITLSVPSGIGQVPTGSGTANWTLPGGLLSGHIGSGQIGAYQLGSGSVLSGYGSYGTIGSVDYFCSKCSRKIAGTAYSGSFVYKDGEHYCYSCCNYDPTTKSFTNRKDWILEGLQNVFVRDTPLWVIADYLEEHSRQADADYLRKLMEG